MERDYGSSDLLEDLAIHLERELLKEGIEPEEAKDKAVSIAEKIRTNWAGQNLYFPAGIMAKFKKRNKEIFDAFNGSNYQQLAKDNGLTEMRIRQIINRMRIERRNSK